EHAERDRERAARRPYELDRTPTVAPDPERAAARIGRAAEAEHAAQFAPIRREERACRRRRPGAAKRWHRFGARVIRADKCLIYKASVSALPHLHAIFTLLLTAFALYLFTRDTLPLEASALAILVILVLVFQLFPYERAGEELPPAEFIAG